MAVPELLPILLAAAVSAGTPILLAGLGELVTERAGVLNLGVEGLMVVGAWVGFGAALATGSAPAGVGAAMLAGGALSLVHALPSVLLGVNQVVSGLALLFLGSGLASALGTGLVGQPGPAFAPLPLPGLATIPLLGPVFFSQNALVYAGLLAVPLVGLFLHRTRPGLALAVCGENPRLADAVGVPLAQVRVAATVFGGAMAGLAGASLSLAETPGWVEGLVGGRGWIALAMVIFSGWSPARLLLGAWMFGGLVALQFRAQAFGLDLPVSVLKAVPYLATLAVLVFARGRLRHRLGAPAALGLPYERDARES